MKALHFCSSSHSIHPATHNIEKGYAQHPYGCAEHSCYEGTKGGKLYVTNDEYENTVNFCPYCGYKAGIQVYTKK